jgi:rhodanese-related sulfurtransferase
MGKMLLRALLLIGIGIGAGFVHAKLRPLAKLPEKPPVHVAGAQENPAPPAQIVQNPVPGSEAPAVPTPTAPQVPDPPAQGTQPSPAAMPAAAEQPATDGYFISVAKAKEFYDKKMRNEWDGFFIDARPYNEYQDGHIPGAMHLPKEKVAWPKARNYLPGMPVIIYCHGESCTDSEAVAKRLVALNLHIGPIHIIKEGLPGWQQAGYPVDKGGEAGFD